MGLRLPTVWRLKRKRSGENGVNQRVALPQYVDGTRKLLDQKPNARAGEKLYQCYHG